MAKWRFKCWAGLAALALAGLGFSLPSLAADPITIGFSSQLTGRTASNGKAILAAHEMWIADVNAKGGLLGRPVQVILMIQYQGVKGNDLAQFD